MVSVSAKKVKKKFHACAPLNLRSGCRRSMFSMSRWKDSGRRRPAEISEGLVWPPAKMEEE
jgi:hypothetical protein